MDKTQPKPHNGFKLVQNIAASCWGSIMWIHAYYKKASNGHSQYQMCIIHCNTTPEEDQTTGCIHQKFGRSSDMVLEMCADRQSNRR